MLTELGILELGKKLLKASPYIAAILLLAYCVNWIHQDGVEQGRSEVRQEWGVVEKHRQDEITRIKEEYAQREAQHRAENTRITHELAEATKAYELAVGQLAADYGQRLSLSEKRAGIYQRQAEAGAAECRSLAEHAGRLDSALEEGRSLVQEFRATLGLRDQQVKSLANQIRNDRKLME